MVARLHRVLKKILLLPTTYLSGIMGNQRLTFFHNIRIIEGLYYPKRLKVTHSTTRFFCGIPVYHLTQQGNYNGDYGCICHRVSSSCSRMRSWPRTSLQKLCEYLALCNIFCDTSFISQPAVYKNTHRLHIDIKGPPATETTQQSKMKGLGNRVLCARASLHRHCFYCWACWFRGAV